MIVNKTSQFLIKIDACNKTIKKKNKSIYSIYCFGTNQSYIHESLMI